MKDEFTKQWILDTGIPIIESYAGNITLRQLHYRLVAAGMTNDQNHYKRVIAAMEFARWENMVSFDAFVDHERESMGETLYAETTVENEVADAKNSIAFWADYYRKNRWENQPIYPEVFIEKKALQGVFEDTCKKYSVALNPCKGYPSLTFLNDASKRFSDAEGEGKTPLILYFGDYDPSGEDIPRSIGANLSRMGVDVEVKRIALMKEQVLKWKLPPAPAKKGDSRTARWGGLGQVELDAVMPNKIVELCEGAILNIFDPDLYQKLKEQEAEEKIKYKKNLKKEIRTLFK